MFSCSFDNVDGAFVWFDDHLVCQHGAYNFSNGNDINKTDGSLGNPLLLLSRKPVVVRARAWASNLSDANASVDVRWSIDGTQMAAIEPALLTTDIDAAEVERVANAESLSQGWGLW